MARPHDAKRIKSFIDRIHKTSHLVASMKIMMVENKKSLGVSREQNPPGKTTVAQREARVPTALPAHSNKATQNAIIFSHFSLSSSPPASISSACSVVRSTVIVQSPPPLPGVVAIVCLPRAGAWPLPLICMCVFLTNGHGLCLFHWARETGTYVFIYLHQPLSSSCTDIIVRWKNDEERYMCHEALSNS